MDDWVQGVKLLNFPITEADARKIFTAIDIDSDNGARRRVRQLRSAAAAHA